MLTKTGPVKPPQSFSAHKKLLDKGLKSLKRTSGRNSHVEGLKDVEAVGPSKAGETGVEVAKEPLREMPVIPKQVANASLSSAPAKNVLGALVSENNKNKNVATPHTRVTDNSKKDSLGVAGVKRMDIQDRINEWKKELLSDMSRARGRGANKQGHVTNVDTINNPPKSLVADDILKRTFVAVRSLSGLNTYHWPIETVKQTSGPSPLVFSCNPLFFDFLKTRKSLRRQEATRALFGTSKKACNKASFDDDPTAPSNAARWETSDESGAEAVLAARPLRRARRRSSSPSRGSSRSSRDKSSRKRRRRSASCHSSCSRSCSSYSSSSSSSSRSYSRSTSSSSRASSRSGGGYHRSKYRGRKRRRSRSRSYSDRNFIKRIYKICPTALPKIPKSSGKDGVPTQTNKAGAKTSTSQIPLPEVQLSQHEKFQFIGPNDPLVFKTSQAPDITSAPTSEENKKDSFVIPPDQLEKYKALRLQAERHANSLNGVVAGKEEMKRGSEERRSPVVVKEYSGGNKDPQLQLVENLYRKQMAAIMCNQRQPIRNKFFYQQKHQSEVTNVAANKVEEGGKRRSGNNFSQPGPVNSHTFVPLMPVSSSVVRGAPLYLRPQSFKADNHPPSEQEGARLQRGDSDDEEMPCTTHSASVASQEPSPLETLPSNTSPKRKPSSEAEQVVPGNREGLLEFVDTEIPSLPSLTSTPSMVSLDNSAVEMEEQHLQHMLLGENLVKPAIQQDFIQIVHLPSQHQLLKQQQQQQQQQTQLHLLQQAQLQMQQQQQQQQQQLQLNFQLQQQQQQQKQLQLQSLQAGNIFVASPVQATQLTVPIVNRQGLIIGTARKQPTILQVPTGQLVTPTLVSAQPMLLGPSNQILLPRFIR